MLLMDLFVYLLLKACFLQFAHTNSRHAYRCSISVYLKLRQENVPHEIRYSLWNIVIDKKLLNHLRRYLGFKPSKSVTLVYSGSFILIKSCNLLSRNLERLTPLDFALFTIFSSRYSVVIFFILSQIILFRFCRTCLLCSIRPH